MTSRLRQPSPHRQSADHLYRVERLHDPEAFLARCQALAGPRTLPFLAPAWLRAWYATLGAAAGVEPLLLAVRHASGGHDLALLPWVVRTTRGLKVVEWADGGVSDYLAPLLAADWALGLPEPEAAQALWRAVRPLLRGCDLLRGDKLLPAMIDEPGAGPNPFAQVWPVRRSALSGNEFVAAGRWDDWRAHLDKSVRKDIERCWRVFLREPQAQVELAGEPARAHALFEVLEAQQRHRMQAQGKPYRLDEPAFRAFYRRAIDEGLAEGRVVVAALSARGEVIAVVLGAASGTRYFTLRQSMAAQGWKQVSPGRLLHEAAMEAMHGRGLSRFDYGIGDYPHKAALKLAAVPLLEFCVPLSPLGAPAYALWRAKPALRRLRAAADLRGLRSAGGGASA